MLRTLKWSLVRQSAGMSLLTFGPSPLDIRVKFAHPVHFYGRFKNQILINNIKS